MEQIRRIVKWASDFVRKKLAMVAKYQKRGYDNRARPRYYEPDDLVFRFSTPDAQRKLGPSWDGAYKIIEHLGGGTYRIKTATGSETFHVDYLKPVFDREGNIRTCNLWRAPEYQRQLALGIELLKFDKKGRVIPGKDCPEVTVKKYELYGAVAGPRRRNKWTTLDIEEVATGARVFKPEIKTTAEINEYRRRLNQCTTLLKKCKENRKK